MPADVRWHFIGRRSNKARTSSPPRPIYSVHVDSLKLAQELQKRIAAAGRNPLAIMVQVNVGRHRRGRGAADCAALAAEVARSARCFASAG